MKSPQKHKIKQTQNFRVFFGKHWTKGQLISKAIFLAVDSPKKRMDKFPFFDLKSCYVEKSNAVRSFFWRNNGLEICFRN